MLRAHRRYPSELPIKVWAASLDEITCYVDRSEDLFVLTDGRRDAEISEVRMSGREFGSLPVSQDW